nr:hypothetical protein [Kitasatospora sp. SID7827]
MERAGLPTAGAYDLLAHGDDWETGLALLEEAGGGRPLPAAVWGELTTAAEQLYLPRSAAWCRWRHGEARSDLVVRAELALPPAGEGRRGTAFDGAGVLRPLWDIGDRTPEGGPDLAVAALWVEGRPALGPGELATVRLAPLSPERWRGLRPGQVVTMHEGRPVGGTAVVLEARRHG